MEKLLKAISNIIEDKDEKLIQKFCSNRNIELFYCKSVGNVLEIARKEKPDLFIFDFSSDNHNVILNLIKDCRLFFGIFPIIIALGKKGDIIFAHAIEMGCNDCFTSPLDIYLFENSLSSHFKNSESFKPFVYRSTPSGGLPVKIRSRIQLKEINSYGIEFSAKTFFPKGFIFKLKIPLDETFPSLKNISYRILQNTLNPEEDIHTYSAEFYEITEEKRKSIIDQLIANGSG